MKKNTFLKIMFLIAFGASNVPAQFGIKIPKIGKPKIEQPKTTGGDSSSGQDTNANQNSGSKSKNSVGFMPKPQPTNVPVLLKDSINIVSYTQNRYWKTPNEANHSSWIPRIQFNLFYDESETIHYKVEWLNPDGSLWFSVPVENRQGYRTEGADFDTKAIDAAGNYGVRLLNAKTKEVVFQGKFKVGKTLLNPKEPRYKNQAMFYVDNDWSLPVGYVGFNWNDSWDFDPSPTVYLWFKGDLQASDFEARLFQNNQLITSTDDGGSIGDDSTFAGKRNPDSCFQNTENCRYTLWVFNWKNFKVESLDPVEHKLNSGYTRSQPNAVYTKDKPGEYTVKIFYKGQQVREMKFTVQPNGYLALNAFAAQIPMDNLRIVVPVKIMGTLDKYNPAAWKTDAFYGNPLPGFVTP